MNNSPHYEKEQKDHYKEELEKFYNKEVIVEDTNGKVIQGICRAIYPTHLNIILMTKDEKIIVKNVYKIRRKRTYLQE